MKTRRIRMIAVLALALALAMPCAAFADAAADSQKLDTYYSLAVNYIGREEYDKAMEYLDAALGFCSEAANPDLCADIHLKKGCVYTMQEDYPSALAELDESIRIQPELSEAWLVKTQVYSDTAAYSDAVESLEKYIELTGDQSMNETLAQLYRQSGEAEKALDSYKAYLAANGTEGAESAYLLGVYEMDMGLYTDAAAAFADCLDDEEYGASAAYNTGVCQMNAADYAAALEAFTACVEKKGEFDGLYYNLGVCNMSLEKYEAAAESFSTSIESESYKSDATYNRAICRMTLGEYQSAIEDFTAYLDGKTAELNAAEGEDAEGAEPAEAGDALPQLEQEKTFVDVAAYYRGVCWLSVEEYDKAAADFTACMENGIAESDSLFNRGLCYLQGGKYEDAKADFTACIEKDTNTDEALFYRSYAYRYLEDNESALADLTACIEREYNLAQSYYQRAQVYSAMGDDDHYVKDLEASLNY